MSLTRRVRQYWLYSILVSRIYLSLCFPAFNEAANIHGQISDALRAGESIGKEFEVIIVNDGSTDETKAIVSTLQHQDPRIRLVNHVNNRGYGAAVWSGLKAAKGEYLFYSDADRQFNLKEIAKLFAYIEQFDVVIGYRRKRQDHFIRRVNTWGWARLTSLLLGTRVKDPDCAFKLFRRTALAGVSVRSQGAVFSPELLMKLRRSNRSIKEVAVTHLPRRAGSPTGASINVIVRALKELFGLWRSTHYSNRRTR